MTVTHQDATKARLLEAAGEEFAEKGFAAARVRSICQRAGANLAAINYHFGDKEQLYAQAVLEAFRCQLRAFPEVLAEESPARQLRLAIHGFLSNVLALSRDPSWHHDLMMRELVRPTTASESLARDVIRPRYELLRGIVSRICPRADEQRLTALTFSVIGQCLHYKLARAVCERLIGREALEALDLDYLTDHITAVCLAALGLGPSFDEEGQPTGRRARPDARTVGGGVSTGKEEDRCPGSR